MNTNYPLVVYYVNSTTDGFWYGRYLGLEGVSGSGKTREEAAKLAEENLLFHLESMIDLGQSLPPVIDPFATSFSGTLSLRLPKSLHQDLALFAEVEGVSINQFIVSTLNEKVGYQKALESRIKEPPNHEKPKSK